MPIALKKLTLGYVPFTTAAVLIAFLIISNSRSWGAALAGGALFLFWAGSIAAFQLIIFKLKYQRGFYIKCLAVTFVSVIASPFATGGLYKIANIIQKGKPDFEGDLARETSVCKISKIDKERRMGGTTYYIEAELSCTSIPNQKSVVWWYSYNDKKGKWSRIPTKNLPK